MTYGSALDDARRMPGQGSISIVSIGRGALMFGAFSLWCSFGFNAGFQKLMPTQAASIIALLCALADQVAGRGWIPTSTRGLQRALNFASFAIIALSLASIVNSVSFIDPIRFSGRYVYGLIMVQAAMMLWRGDNRFIRQLILAFVLGGVVTTALCMLGHVYAPLGKIVFQDMFSRRARGLLIHPNQTAMLFAAALPLTLWSGLAKTPIRQVLAAIMVVGVILTGSKFNMALILLVLPLVMVWMPLREGRGMRAVVSVLAIGPVTLIAAQIGLLAIKLNSPIYYQKLVQFFSDPTGATTTETRVFLWERAWQCGSEHPFVGIGAANAPYCFTFAHAHNVVVNYFVELGVTGVTLLLIFIGVCLTISARTMAEARAAMQRVPVLSLYRLSALLALATSLYFVANLSSDSMGPATMQTLWLLLATTLLVHAGALRVR